MKIFRLVLSALMCVNVALTFTVYKNLSVSGKGLSQTTNYQGIISVWQVDVFEGGIGSRAQFLSKVAKEFEKKNPGVIVMVTTHTVSSVENNFKKGIYPDLLSCGNGIDFQNLSPLCITKKFEGGQINGKDYFVPWCKGGYALIKNTKLVDEKNESKALPKLLVSKGEYTQPLVALSEAGYTAKEVIVKPPFEAYAEYVLNKTPYFLGTQRDVNRLISRGAEFSVVSLSEFNDLYQYLCLTTTEAKDLEYSRKFAEYLLDNSVQDRISEIGMFSQYTLVEYENSPLYNLSQSVANSALSPLITKEALKETFELSKKAVCGDKNAQIKIKNMFVKP